MSVRPAKTQISLGIRPVSSESSLCAQWVAKGQRFLHADSEDSDQTGWMPRLIRVFAGHTLCWFCHVAAHIIHTHLNSIILDVEVTGYSTLVCAGKVSSPLVKPYHASFVEFPPSVSDKFRPVLGQGRVRLKYQEKTS